MLGIVALMFLLLPFLLLTTSADKLVALDLGLAAEDGLPPAPSTGTVESIDIALSDRVVSIEARVRRADVTANQGEARLLQTRLLPVKEDLNLGGLQETLRGLKRLDPNRERATLRPADGTPVHEVVAVMDAMRGDSDSALFPEIVLQDQVQP